MIEVTTTADPAESVVADVLVVGVTRGDAGPVLSPDAAAVDAASGGALTAFLEASSFEAKARETAAVAVSGVGARMAVLAGLGDPDQADVAALRSTCGAISRATGDAVSVACALGAETGLDAVDCTRAVVEGWLLGTYKFTRFKSEPEPVSTTALQVVGGDAAAAARAAAVARATTLARDLSNRPAGDLTPSDLAAEAERIAATASLQVEVWDRDRIAAERLGGLQTVSAGSAQEPRLIRITYEPEVEATATLVLVGKGITFDSGGLSLKTADGMMTMKTDMSGAAAVIAAMSVLGELGPPVRVVGIVPASENMPSGKAVKPGDVFSARNGKTVEVLNTDAEGRLVLADALSLAVETEPDAIIDLATLTGACVVALGQEWAGYFSNDAALAEGIESASASAGEPVWRMPLVESYRKRLDSEVADLRNIATGSGGGAITAALFLQQFTGDVAWAHVDIAGPSRVDSTDGHVVKGSSGFGAALLVDLVDAWASGS
ncbi:MAG: leucyl aminopeptidase [Acidimicrobiia bacterium]|nr:leucyl aminopeptidase [Acidimicrobiia bacterium]